jgi:hypothetical protein
MKKSGSLVVLFLLLVIFTLFGCASTTMGIQRETARNLGGDVDPESVMVSDVDRGMSDIKWLAEVDGKKYKCYADDMMRKVNCIPVKAPAKVAPKKTSGKAAARN